MMRRLFPLARPLLHALDAETAHGLTVKTLALLPHGAPPAAEPLLAQTLWGLAFANPVGLAAGFDKNAEVPDAMLAQGFGFVEVGTLTPRPQPGNPRPRLFRLPADAAVINRFGFNNDGHAAAHARLAARPRRAGVVGVNIGANKDSADRAADYAAGITAFADVADYFTVNVSSPNTPGLRDLQARDALDDLLARAIAARDAAGQRRPLLLKVAPDLTLGGLDDVVAVARARGVDGMIVSNTTVERPASLREAALAREAGGLSGAPLLGLSTRVLAETYLRVEGAFPLVGAGGIDSPQAALLKLGAGASLVQLYSALVFQGPGLVRRIVQGLSEAVAASPGRSLTALIGQEAEALAREP